MRRRIEKTLCRFANELAGPIRQFTREAAMPKARILARPAWSFFRRQRIPLALGMAGLMSEQWATASSGGLLVLSALAALLLLANPDLRRVCGGLSAASLLFGPTRGVPGA